jgi:hypothetical protein
VHVPEKWEPIFSDMDRAAGAGRSRVLVATTVTGSSVTAALGVAALCGWISCANTPTGKSLSLLK